MKYKKFLYKLFGDTIEYRNISDNIILFKHNKPGTYIKKGTKIGVRKNQSAFIIKNDVLYTVLRPGTYYLLPDSFPEITFQKGFKSLVDMDLYMLNQKPMTNNPWSNKNPVTIQDTDLKHVQLRAFGTYSFRIEDAYKFVSEVFVKKKKYFTCNILVFLSSYVAKAVEESIQESGLGITELMNTYSTLEDVVSKKLKKTGQAIGIDFVDIRINNLSIPMVVQQYLEDKKWKEIESRYRGYKLKMD